MELNYTKVGDYYIPNIKAPYASKHPIGKYGRMRKKHLAEHRPVLYESMILNGTLLDHLSEIEKSCNERMEHLTSEMMKNEGITESLKAADQMEWVRRMNNIRHRADETVLHELVYD
jgi:hypothetical protein